MTLLGFRDPHEYAKQEIFMLGLDNQEDQPLYDAIQHLTRDQASYLRLLLLDSPRIDGVITMTKDRLTELIDTAKLFSIVEGNSQMQ
jgi:hypothetical protein